MGLAFIRLISFAYPSFTVSSLRHKWGNWGFTRLHALSRNTKLLGGHTRFESCKAGLTPSSLHTFLDPELVVAIPAFRVLWFLEWSGMGGCQILYCVDSGGRWTGPGLEPTAWLCQARVQQASQDEQAGLDWPGRNRQRRKCSVSGWIWTKVRQSLRSVTYSRLQKADRTTEWATAFKRRPN